MVHSEMENRNSDQLQKLIIKIEETIVRVIQKEKKKENISEEANT